MPDGYEKPRRSAVPEAGHDDEGEHDDEASEGRGKEKQSRQGSEHSVDPATSEAEASDGALHDFWHLHERDIQALHDAHVEGDPDPGRDMRLRERTGS